MASEDKNLTQEQRFIELIKDLTGEKLIGDDCAILPGHELVTSDMLVEGTHFDLSNMSLADIGWKAMAVNLSDIAAMGGYPVFAICNLCLPPYFSCRELRQLYESLVDCAKQYKTRVIGGDLVCGDLLTVSIAIFGKMYDGYPLKRSGAKVEHSVIVTGDFGASAAGLWLITNEISSYPYTKAKHCHPQPRLEAGQFLARLCDGNGAMMDASDGLADACIQIARASNVGIHLDSSAITINKETRMVADQAGQNVLDWALYGGEDYELVACVPDFVLPKLQNENKHLFSCVGKVVKEKGVRLYGEGQICKELEINRTFQHWN